MNKIIPLLIFSINLLEGSTPTIKSVETQFYKKLAYETKRVISTYDSEINNAKRKRNTEL